MLLVILFTIKFLAHIDIFKYIRKKHGRYTLKITRKLEQYHYKIAKINLDIIYIKTCKKENLIPTFAKSKLAIKTNFKTKLRIARIIMETELQNKHYIKKNLKRNLLLAIDKIKGTFSCVLFIALIHKIRKIVNIKLSKVLKRHKKKLMVLRSKYGEKNNSKLQLQNTISNYSSYTLTIAEENALRYGLDQHIPSNTSSDKIRMEFESFYQNITPHIQNIEDENVISIKTKLLNSCEQYSKIKTCNKHNEALKSLQSNNSITILKKDKGKGSVILDKSLYVDKCNALLNTPQFKQLTSDPTRKYEGKIQRQLRKIKPHLTPSQYRKIYPTGSNPGRFYGTAKVHKLKENDGVKELTLRPIVSNIGSASYELAKFLANFLSPLSISEYTVKNTQEFITFTKNVIVPTNYKLVSFDVTSLFTNVPLKETIDIILKRIYISKEIVTEIEKENLKKLLFSCTKEVHFSFNEKLYIQNDGVCMGSPLGPVLANIFMVELERTIIPVLSDCVYCWKRYVDDTFTIIDASQIDVVTDQINNFHHQIKFTHEQEQDDQISFLDVKITRKGNHLETEVYRKPTCKDIYIHWESFAPLGWKKSTLKTLALRAYRICSNEILLKKELDYLRKVFHDINGYPHKIINNVFNSITLINQRAQEITQNNNSDLAKISLTLPYMGHEGHTITNKLKSQLKRLLPNNIEMTIINNAKRISSCFNNKDAIPKEHKHDNVYQFKCAENGCDAKYIGESGRRLAERIIDHNGRDNKSHIIKHSIDQNHPIRTNDQFEIINSGFRSNYKKRKIAEALAIRHKKPNLNVLVFSSLFFLFN